MKEKAELRQSLSERGKQTDEPNFENIKYDLKNTSRIMPPAMWFVFNPMGKATCRKACKRVGQ
jgi:hypothetical protein